jgi:putative chitinase
MIVTTQILRQVAYKYHGTRETNQGKVIDTVGPIINSIMNNYSISTFLRRAHFLAQTCAESDGFCTMTEYASGKEYEGRKDLGDVKAGDGVRYKGRV